MKNPRSEQSLDQGLYSQWEPIVSAPSDRPVDVRYSNPTFRPPSEGILKDAKLGRDGLFWIARSGSQVPSKFAVSWRPSADEEARNLDKTG